MVLDQSHLFWYYQILDIGLSLSEAKSTACYMRRTCCLWPEVSVAKKHSKHSSNNSPTSKTLPARGVRCGLRTSISHRPTNNCINDLSSGPPPCNSGTSTLPYCDHHPGTSTLPYCDQPPGTSTLPYCDQPPGTSTLPYCDHPPGTSTLPYCDQPLQNLGAVDDKTWSSTDFTTRATPLSCWCSYLLNNNNQRLQTSCSVTELTSCSVTELTSRRSRKQSSGRRIPHHKSMAMMLWFGTEKAVAQDTSKAVVWRSTSARASSNLYHPAHPQTRWNSRMSLSTWLGNVKFPLPTSTCQNTVLTTPPATKMRSHGSIIYQKSPALSVGT